MNILFNDTITVYNYYRDAETGNEIWKRTVVKGVQWRHNRIETVTRKNEQEVSRTESITIDFNHSYGNTASYLPSHEFKKLKPDELSDFWTLNTRDGQDKLVLGICDKEIGTDCKLSELEEYAQYVATVVVVADNRNMPRLKHIKVVGK